VLGSLLLEYAKVGAYRRAEAACSRLPCIADSQENLQILASTCAQAGTTEGARRAEHWLSVMRDRGYEASLDLVELVFGAIVRSGDMDAASYFISIERDSGRSYQSLYNTALAVCGRSGDGKHVYWWLREMRLAGV